MNRMSAERWRTVRTALDELLELNDEDKQRWLSANADDDAELAAELRALLALHADPANAQFLGEKLPPALNEIAPGSLQGMRIGNYVLDSLIGQGGMGTVWAARRDDGHFEGRVAVKLLTAAIRAPEAAHRFMREGRLLAKLSHPNISRLLDAGVSPEGTPYLVIEHVDGEAIDVYCNTRSLALRERVRVFLGVLAAIEHSHTHLIVHRDIKPTNVLVTDDGTPKLLDFGIAGLIAAEDPTTAASARTATLWGGRAMTLQFAAPEQLQGQAATTRTDVYGSGVLLYLLLTGVHPTGLRDVASSAYVTPMVEGRLLRPGLALSAATLSPQERAAIATSRSSLPDRLAQELSGDLDNILLKALKTHPAERYASIAEFALDLQRYLDHRPVFAAPDSAWYRAAKFTRRNRVATAAIACAVLAIALGSALAVRGSREASVEARRAAAINSFVREMFGVGAIPANASIGLRSTTIEQLLDEGRSRLAQQMDLSAEARVDLLGALADMYTGFGQPAKALPLLEQRLALQDEMPVGNPLRSDELVADGLLKIAMNAGLVGDFKRHRVALDRVEPGARALRARAPSIFARWSFETSTRMMALDPAAAAVAAHESAVAYREAGDTFNAVKSMTQQVLGLTRAEEYTQAEALAQEAMRIAQAMRPVNPELLGHAYSVRADLDFLRLRLASAERGFRDTVRSFVAAKGEIHPATARARMRLMRVLQRRGAYAECLSEGQAAVAAVEKSSGLDDRRVLPSVLEELGRCQLGAGLLDEALVTFERSAGLWDPTAFGGVLVGTVYREISRTYLRRGDLARAELARTRMLEVMNATARASRALETAILTAELRIAQGRAADAMRELEPFAKTLNGARPLSWDVVDLHMAWARTLDAGGDTRATGALLAARQYLITNLRDETPLLRVELDSMGSAATGARRGLTGLVTHRHAE